MVVKQRSAGGPAAQLPLQAPLAAFKLRGGPAPRVLLLWVKKDKVFFLFVCFCFEERGKGDPINN